MLDDRERRILDDTERFLAQDDPVLAEHLRSLTPPAPAPVRVRRRRTERMRALPGWLVVAILLTVALVLLALPAVVSGREPAATPTLTCLERCPAATKVAPSPASAGVRSPVRP